jgi:hypothetical protein
VVAWLSHEISSVSVTGRAGQASCRLVGSIVVACHLLDQVNYGASKTCLFDLHECLDERQAIGGGKEVGDIGEEKRVGRFL